MSSIPRFFVSPSDILDCRTVTLPPEDSHHAYAVLRLRGGETIIVLDNTGTEHEARLTEVGKHRVTAEIVQSRPCETEPKTKVTIYHAIPKTAEKIEQVLQHGTEIGATGFAIFRSARSVVWLDPAREDRRLTRWRGIVKASAQQSGRGILPEVTWCGANLPPDTAVPFFLHEKSAIPLRDVLQQVPPEQSRFALYVGPEGGFTEEEITKAVRQGAISISLGPRILRTETAALVALSQILYDREK